MCIRDSARRCNAATVGRYGFLDLDRYEPETGSVIPYPSYPDPHIGDLRAVSAPEDEERVTVASSFALQERRAQLERLADIARSKLARVEWDADAVSYTHLRAHE